MLITRALSKIYETRTNIVKAVDNVSLTIEDGEFAAIVGTSGSGKTTLLNMLGGLSRPSIGSIAYNQTLLESLTEEELSIFRRQNIGFVFQSYNLVPVLNVFENIVLPAKLNHEHIEEDHVHALASSLGIEEKLFEFPEILSGGQQQRVAIARAIYMKPEVILADEPTGNLDSETTAEVMNLLKQLSGKYKLTMVVVTHDDQVAKMADRIIRMKDGSVMES